LDLLLEIPDINYWKEQIKCQVACPVHTDARGYVRAIADGDDELAYFIARGPNPLASICGRVCGAPCETQCRRGDYDKPIAIRALKRFVSDQFGPQARPDGGKTLIQYLKDAATRFAPRQCQDKEELLPMLQALMNGNIPKVEEKSVGIIGSGPAGLAAAHDLALLGFSVTIYEMEEVLAGMLALGIPEYRLPRDLIRAEVEVITSMGVEAVTNCTVGKDVSFSELREKHDAVIVAAGAKKSRFIPLPGIDGDGVIGGVEFLRDVALGNPAPLGKNMVVIGGGNVAYDVGRTVVRQTSIDAARTAKRTITDSTVHLVSLESLEEMPADDIEIIEGDEEGVQRHNSLGPKEIVRDSDGKITSIVFQKCTQVFDDEKRFSPKFDENDLTEIPCDTVLISVGQGFDLSFIDAEKDKLEMLPNGAIKCDAETGTTNQPDVYVAGDLAYGPKLLIHGVASGKSVARSIYKQVTGVPISTEATELHFAEAFYSRESDYEKSSRVAIPSIEPSERLTSQAAVVESGYTESQARAEACRCLNCGVNTIFDGERCILCGGCVDVCPENCLLITPLDRVESTNAPDSLIPDYLDGFPVEEASAIVKDELICIRCALCAERCPVGAITMEDFHFEEKPTCQAG
jgi:NADPH-dependent glutamate synthase beta subunit-like oxidoreductase/ferredoxin